MAGSYKHVTTSSGHLRDESFTDLIENLGDAYEAIKEMYGMIWYLVVKLGAPYPLAAVEDAREHHGLGLWHAAQYLGPRAPELEDDDA